jgi:hypothetical protein
VTPREAVIGFLGSARAVLVMDNCEHVCDAAADLVDGGNPRGRWTSWQVVPERLTALSRVPGSP